MKPRNFDHLVIAITGSTGGLGSALARRLHELGARLALMDVSATAVEAQAKTFADESTVAGFEANVRSMASLQEAMAAAQSHFGQLDVVIANAGIDTMAPMASIEPEAFDRVIDVNLNGVWRTFRAALPFVEKQQGYLLAISSMAAFIHSPLQASYTASKAGVWAMCDSVRLELRHLGVAVGSVHPTFFPTPIMDDVTDDPAGQALWAGNRSGFWKMITITQVTDAIVQGIERRQSMIVVPKRNTFVAWAPGLFRKIIERFGFSEQGVRRAIELSDSSGWVSSKANERARKGNL